jgi:hypothetical protein
VAELRRYVDRGWETFKAGKVPSDAQVAAALELFTAGKLDELPEWAV